MEVSSKKKNTKKLQDRLRESSFPPAAVLGAFASFVATAADSQARVRVTPAPKASLVQISFDEPKRTLAPAGMEIEYSRVLTLGDAASAHPFRRSLSGAAVDSADRIFALGDGEVRIFESSGKFLQGWKAPEDARCIALGPDGHVYFGAAAKVEICDAAGVRVGGFAAGENSHPANVTAIKIFGKEIFVADAAARFIRKYDLNGKLLGSIGTQGKTRGFMLPNGSLDFDLTADGVVFAADSGRHRISSWSRDGAPLSQFGKFGYSNPQDFVGCCNPVNLALTPDGKIVTAEKVIARVKVYDPSGKLLAFIGPEHFDPKCIHLHLAVNSKGQILTADPVRLEVKVFSATKKAGGSKSV